MFHCYFASQVATMARAGPDQSQDFLWFSRVGAGGRGLGTFSMAFPGHLARSWIRGDTILVPGSQS